MLRSEPVKYLQVIALCCIVSGCSTTQKELSYELVTYSGDLKVEQFDSAVTDENRFNDNNIIYPVGASYTYSYQYYKSDGEPMNFRFIENGWEFVEPTAEVVNKITLSVRSGLKPFSDWYPDYNQTVFTYQLSNKESYELTGLIENEANLWLHPPREGLFKIMQLNPFPFVAYPLEKGNKWEWSVQIGNSFADKRWATWEGIITGKTTYEVTDHKIMDTPWGKLETWIITAEAVNELGKTSMRAVFNYSLGFLEMNFVNIDGSEITFKLEEVD
ncbi:hypothetical protein [Gracilimonas tropica]|uniref:hypothetical protein n=1 Tax=Gracilimonas tropica TaxID=454600 RepID=UPI0003741C18|nr:hypothetical protein [Gracilimonas tropica]